jgi:hypothetical protein
MTGVALSNDEEETVLTVATGVGYVIVSLI